MRAALAKHPEEEGVKLNLHFRADASGLLHVERGEAVVNVTEEYTVKARSGSPPVPSARPFCCCSV
jgi:hypothetical protein